MKGGRVCTAGPAAANHRFRRNLKDCGLNFALVFGKSTVWKLAQPSDDVLPRNAFSLSATTRHGKVWCLLPTAACLMQKTRPQVV